MSYTYGSKRGSSKHSAARRIQARWRGGKARSAVDRAQNKSIGKLWNAVNYSKEKKYVDQGNTIQMASSWVNMLTRDLTYIGQGTSGNERDGNKIKILSHDLKIIATVGDSTNLYRFLVIRFNAVQASQVQISDALETPVASTPFNLMSHLKRNTDSKYKVLYDSGICKLAGNDSATAPASASSQRVHQIHLSNGKKGWYTAYNGAGANTVVQGFTYLIGVSDSALPSHVQFQVNSRTIFSG